MKMTPPFALFTLAYVLFVAWMVISLITGATLLASIVLTCSVIAFVATAALTIYYYR